MIEAALQLRKDAFHLAAEFSAPGTGVTALFGPSGCGKTSLLRAIAGLEPDTEGSLSVNGAQWLSAQHLEAVQKRGVGYVFQSPSLFPHLTVEENLLYGRKRLTKALEPIEYKQLINLLGIGELLSRYPGGLSGGEAQRVALGRALLAEPRLLLMDEPLSALDQQSRGNLMSLLEKFLQYIDIPVLYVTHSSEEVARLADNLLLLNGGRVSQCGPIQQVLSTIDNELGRSDAAFSVVAGAISEESLPGLISVDCGGGLALRVPQSAGDHAPGSKVRLRIRARDVSLCLEQPRNTSILNILPAVIEELAPGVAGGSWTVKLDLQGRKLLSKISEYSVQQLGLERGQAVFAQVKSASLI